MAEPGSLTKVWEYLEILATKIQECLPEQERYMAGVLDGIKQNLDAVQHLDAAAERQMDERIERMTGGRA